MNQFSKVIKTLLSLFLLWFGIHSAYIVIDGLVDKNTTADVAIVLGNKVNEDGTLSPRLNARLNKALELYQNERVKYIIVSGGLGSEGYWEGDKMKEHLVKNQVPKELILVDNYGDNTQKTVSNSLLIMDRMDLKSAISVSQYFHQSRIKMLFHKNGFENIKSASPRYFESRDFYSIFREFFAYYSQMRG